MARVRNAVARHKRKKRVLKSAKGHFGDRSKRFLQAKRSVLKGLTYAFRDRRVKKREMKSLWIVRINAACREAGISYSRFIKGLANAKIAIDRKMLAELAVSSPASFKKIVKAAQEAATVTKKTKSSKAREKR